MAPCTCTVIGKGRHSFARGTPLILILHPPLHVANYSMSHTEKSSRDEALLCVLDEQSVDQSNSIAHAVCPLSRIAIYIA